MITEVNTDNRAQGRRGLATRQLPRSDSYQSASSCALAARSYLRSLRAAEMAAWDMTGGDCVLACFVDSSKRAFTRAA
jgi:hypothetical protein